MHLFLAFKGKALISRQLEELTDRKVDIGYFDVRPYFNIEIRDLNIEGLANIESVYISPSVLSLLLGNVAIGRIVVVNPKITYERVPSQVQQLEDSLTSGDIKKKDNKPINKEYILRLALKHVIIKNGEFNFIDHTVGPEGIAINVKNINAEIKNFYFFPVSAVSDFELSGSIPWQKGKEEGKVNIDGWINVFKKSMEAKVKIEKIDGIYLYPYYAQWGVDLEKARIEKATLNFNSDIHGIDNDITAQCHLELTDIVRRPKQEGEEATKGEKIAEVVLDVFKSLNQGKIVLDFTIRTKMSRFKFGMEDIKSAIVHKLAEGGKLNKIKTQELVKIPLNIIQDTFKKINKFSKKLVLSTINIANELKQ